MYVIDFHQDDPKKCTGKKLVRLGYAKLTKSPKGIILNPFSNYIISIEDRKTILDKGITVIDMSWKNANSETFRRFLRNSRRLPFLLAGNPINYAKPYVLSSLEAVAAALYIIEEIDLALEILNKVKWGRTFYELNKELLENYKGRVSEEIHKIENELLSSIK